MRLSASAQNFLDRHGTHNAPAAANAAAAASSEGSIAKVSNRGSEVWRRIWVRVDGGGSDGSDDGAGWHWQRRSLAVSACLAFHPE